MDQDLVKEDECRLGRLRRMIEDHWRDMAKTPDGRELLLKLWESPWTSQQAREKLLSILDETE